MQHEKFTISAGGGNYDAFEDIQVTAAFNEADRTFQFTVAAEAGASATNRIFAVGTPITIAIGGETVVTGYVTTKEPQMNAQGRTISVSGSSKTADLIDGSAVHDSGYFEDKDPLEIAQEISKDYGAKWESDQQLEKVEKYQITPGETCYRCIEKLTRQQGFTITGTPEGNAKITKAGNERNGPLLESTGGTTGNIKDARASQGDRNKHSKIVVRGQRPKGHGDENLEIEAELEDGSVKRFRQITIIQDEDTDKDRAEKRAKNRKNRVAGNSNKATITVQACHDEGGKLWTPGALSYTESPFLDICQDMLIESVTYKQDAEGGTTTTMNLVDPRAYDGEGAGGGKGNKSGSEWEFG